jgi:hypothetical protein
MHDDEYQWDVQQMEDNVFKVNFPSRTDLVKAQHFGRFCVPRTQITLSFDFLRKDVEPVWTAEEVWVRVHGLPPFALDEIPALWAFGDIFGETMDIDLPFTRANNVLRIRISCLDPSLIPANLDVKIRNDFFRLRFEVEGFKAPTASKESLSEDMHKDDDIDHDGPSNNSGDDLDREVKRKKNEEGGKDNDQPTHQAPLTSTSLSLLPITVSQEKVNIDTCVLPRYDNVNMITYLPHDCMLSIPKCLDSLFRDVAVSDEVEGHMATSDLGMAILDEQGAVHSSVQQIGSGLEVIGAAGKEAQVVVHDTRLRDLSVNSAATHVVHGAYSHGAPGSTSTSIAAQTAAVHGACSPRTPIRPGTSIISPTPFFSSTPLISQAQISSAPAKPSSQAFSSNATTDLPMVNAKRTYVHTVKPKQTNTNVSSLPKSVNSMVSITDNSSTCLHDNVTITTCPNYIVSQADGIANKKTVPAIMTTPVSKTHSIEEVIAYGGIRSQVAKGVRSSGRLRAQPNADATQLEKAMMLAQRRNENFAQGTSQPHSLLNFTDEQIIHNAAVLGISMGSSVTEQFSAAHKIKDNELQRTITILKNNESVTGEKVPCLVVSHASDLVADLDDDEHLLNDNDNLLCTSPVVNKTRRNKKKKSYDKNKVRRSNRIRNKLYT